MKGFTLAALVSFTAGQGVFAQAVVQWKVTDHRKTILTENNVSRVVWPVAWPRWEESTLTTEVFSENVLTITRTVFWGSVPYAGRRYYSPKRTETRLLYGPGGPVRGEEIIYERPKATGGTTNQIPAHAMPLLDWRPSVGSIQEGNEYWRMTTSGSPMVCWGTNTSSRPYLVRVPCTSNGTGFYQLFRFEPGQAKPFTISGGVFQIYLEGADEQLLPW